MRWRVKVVWISIVREAITLPRLVEGQIVRVLIVVLPLKAADWLLVRHVIRANEAADRLEAILRRFEARESSG
jgi:hypothetical protein